MLSPRSVTALLALTIAWSLVGADLEARPSPAAAVSPAHPEPEPGPEAPPPASFWDAVATFDIRVAERLAPDREHRAFTRAFQELLDGRMESAESRFLALVRTGSDPDLRRRAQTGLVAALVYQGKWRELDALGRPTGDSAPGTGPGPDSFQAWGAAMRSTPSPTFRFPRRAVELPFALAVTGAPVVPVRINGVEGSFWIDTGSSMTMISSELAARAGVAPVSDDTLFIQAAVGRIRAEAGTVRRLDIGGFAVGDLTGAIVGAGDLTVMVQKDDGEVREKVDGVIGMDVLRRVDLEIDFLQKRISFAKPPERQRRGSAERNLTWLGFPIVRVEQPSGRALYFGLDTGADRTHVSADAIGSIPEAPLVERSFKLAGFGGDTAVDLRVLPTLTLKVAGRQVQLSEVPIHSQRRLGFARLDGIIGSDIMAGLRLRMSMTEGLLEIGLPRNWLQAARGERSVP